MRFYRQEYIKRHDAVPYQAEACGRAKTHKHTRYTDHSMEIQEDLRNIHGKLARFMAYPYYLCRPRVAYGGTFYPTKVPGAAVASQRLQENICIQTNHVGFLRAACPRISRRHAGPARILLRQMRRVSASTLLLLMPITVAIDVRSGEIALRYIASYSVSKVS